MTIDPSVVCQSSAVRRKGKELRGSLSDVTAEIDQPTSNHALTTQSTRSHAYLSLERDLLCMNRSAKLQFKTSERKST